MQSALRDGVVERTLNQYHMIECVTADDSQSVHFTGKTVLLFSNVLRWHTYGAYELFYLRLPSFVRVSIPAIDSGVRRARALPWWHQMCRKHAAA
jgi:hypothetical protein